MAAERSPSPSPSPSATSNTVAIPDELRLTPTLPCELRAALAAQAVDWALANGLVMRQPPPTSVPAPPAAAGASTPLCTAALATHAPFALLPSPFPRSLYDTALSLQPLFNKIVHNICADSEFLRTVTKSIGSSDLFTMQLLEIYEKSVAAEKTRQEAREKLDASAKAKCSFRPQVTLGIYRSDYMAHKIGSSLMLQQVELNTVAASFGALSAKVSQLHRYLARVAPTEYLKAAGDPKDVDGAMPMTDIAGELAGAIAKAHELYGDPRAVVLFVVQPSERNIFDQRHIEHALLERSNIHVVRASLGQLLDGSSNNKNPMMKTRAQEGSATSDASALAQDPPELLVHVHGAWMPVSVVYFRAGYGPEDYVDGGAWRARTMIELSAAIKCPSVAQQLAGTKKMQQILASDGVLTRYAGSVAAADAVARCFTGIFPLDESPEGADALCRALANPDAFVLKPQREGGGNNVYGRQIATHLKHLSARDRAAYILMERISPPSARNTLVRNGQCIDCDVISELGIYGVIISCDDSIVLNSPAGHLLRSKTTASNEGGVAAGFAVLDSPMLMEYL